jgi:hypothetical protein
MLVAASKHMCNIPLNIARRVELWEFTTDGKIQIISAGQGYSLPSADNALSLLTQEETERLIERSGKEPRMALARAFEERFGRTSSEFWKNVGGRKILPEDVLTLSRSFQQRRLLAEWKERQAAYWREWTAVMADAATSINDVDQSVQSSSVS